MKINKVLLWQTAWHFIIFFSLTFTVTEPDSARADERTNYLNNFGVGARAMGLNNAYTASCNDYTAPFWNPAAMDFFTTIKIGAMRSSMSLDRETNYAGFVLPTEKYGAFACAWAGFGIKDIEARTSNTQDPDGYFNSNDNIFFLSYAYRLLASFSIGGNIKLFDYGMQESHANGLGFDLAAFFIPLEKLRFGFIVQDFNSLLKWRSGIDEKFVQTYRLGASYELFSNFSLSCDVSKMGSQKANVAFATEFLTMKIFQIRCGFNEQRFAGGIGFTLPIRGLYLNFNYAVATDRFDAGLSDILDFSVVF
ncbi:MAG TPA: hypothetical protein VGD14_06740 [bacterium]